MPHGSRPGDVLAGRYRLVDLLTESGDGRFWRAHDRVLERHVALHVIRADDVRAPGLLEAAQRSATVHDPHLLRVLDADLADGLCYVVNEWGDGTSLDIVVAGNGPLGPRRAAWLVSQTAGAVGAAHRSGVAHGRLVPENVLIDRTGGVRIIGLCVDAALHGVPAKDPARDVADLAGLLYCALTTTWAGPSASLVPSAPAEHGEVIRPRRVRAGIPRALDALCEEVLRPGPGARIRGQFDLRTARGVADQLAEFVGDPTGMAEALMASTPDVLPEEELVVLPPVPELSVREAARMAEPFGATADADPVDGPPADRPTEAGLPIFGDGIDDVTWLQKSTEPAPPPPPFEQPPERPLFAPTPPDGAPLRHPRASPTAADDGAGYWPWEVGADTGRRAAASPRPVPDSTTGSTSGSTAGRHTRAAPTDAAESSEDDLPGRWPLRLAAGLVVALLLLVAAVVVVDVVRGRDASGDGPAGSSEPRSTGPSPTDSPGGTQPSIVPTGARYFDPLGDRLENGTQAARALDGRPSTAWPTQTYTRQLGQDGFKAGVGLVIDLGAQHDLSAVDLTFAGEPTSAAVYVTARPPTTAPTTPTTGSARPAAGGRARGTTLTLDLAASGRYVLVWLTRLPQVGAGEYRGAIAEVDVHGR